MSEINTQGEGVATTETIAGDTTGIAQVDGSQDPTPAQEAAPEIAPEALAEAAAKTEEDRRFAAKFAALTKREKALKEKERTLNLRMKEIEDKMSAQSQVAPAAKEEPLELRIKRDPFKTLEQLGVNYETLTRIALNDGKLTPELQMQLMKEEIEGKYRGELDEIKNQLKGREEQEKTDKEAKLISDFKGDIGTNIQEGAEKYELLQVEGQDGIDLVYEIIDAHYKETGDILEMHVALDAAEEGLLEEARKRIELSKIKKLLGASQKPPETNAGPASVAQAANATKKETMTLSNQKAQVQPTKSRFLSDEESKKQAAKLIRWNT